MIDADFGIAAKGRALSVLESVSGRACGATTPATRVERIGPCASMIRESSGPAGVSGAAAAKAHSESRRIAGAVSWYRAWLRAAMIVVSLGVMWMHSSAHEAHVCHSHVSDAYVTATAAFDATSMNPDGPAVNLDDESGVDVVQLCAVLATAMCLAVLMLAAWLLRNRPFAFLEPAVQVRNSMHRWTTVLPSGLRWSFMELSVWRI
jgi:hypothetical protein